MKRRISIFGGPGCGKTTLALRLCSDLMKRNHSVWQIREFCKDWALEKRVPESFDQVYLLGQQIYEEDRKLRNGIELIVTDGPVFLCACYAKYYNALCWEECWSIAEKMDQKYESLNIFLKRHDTTYQTVGRYETAEQALVMDSYIREQLALSGRKTHFVNNDVSVDEILELIK